MRCVAENNVLVKNHPWQHRRSSGNIPALVGRSFILKIVSVQGLPVSVPPVKYNVNTAQNYLDVRTEIMAQKRCFKVGSIF